MTITDSSIDNNQGDGSGGIRNDGSMTITNCTIAGNSADYGDGGGVNNAGSMTITGSTIAYNYAEFGVGGLANLWLDDNHRLYHPQQFGRRELRSDRYTLAS